MGSAAAGKKPEVKPMAKPAAGGAPGGQTKTPIADHVSQHGPATKMDYKVEGGKHHVSTHHGGGPSHHSIHQSHQAAHDHMGKAMGLETADNTEQSPDAALDDSQGENDYGGGTIPGLKSA